MIQKINKYILFLLFLILNHCASSYKTETIIEDEICRIKQINGKNFLICDENNNLRVFIKKAHMVKELKDCKKTTYALKKKNTSEDFVSIVCKTNYGYEIIK